MKHRTGPELIQAAKELPPKPITFSDMTVAQLRALLKSHGLPHSGKKKADLVLSCIQAKKEAAFLPTIYHSVS